MLIKPGLLNLADLVRDIKTKRRNCTENKVDLEYSSRASGLMSFVIFTRSVC